MRYANYAVKAVLVVLLALPLLFPDWPQYEGKAMAGRALTYPIAIPFGVLTCASIEQARDRAGGAEGNKGAESMDAALEMVGLRQALTRTPSSARRSARKASSASSRSTR